MRGQTFREAVTHYIALAALIALSLAQWVHGQRHVAAGASIISGAGMGYDSPSVGGWAQYRAGQMRLLGEIDNSRKTWLPDGLSWRLRATVDSPQWRGLSLIGAAGVAQHRNSQWAKTGAWGGAGLRWGPAYSWYSPPDTSPNRVSAWTLGWEARSGHVLTGVEARRYWHAQGRGWSIVTRVGWVWGQKKRPALLTVPR